MSIRRIAEEHIYVNYGHDPGWRHWSDAARYNYVSACGHRHVQDLRRLEPGNRIWVYAPQFGYVGVARVKARAKPASAFKVETPVGLVPVQTVIKDRKMAAHNGEHYASVRWIQTVRSLDEALYASRPLFSSRLVVCQPVSQEWRETVAVLNRRFPAWNS